MSNGKSTWLLLLLCTLFARAQQIDVAIGPNREVRAVSLFDEIQDARERSAFRELWETRDPAKQRERALEFIERYPRSTLLKEAYEIAARACVALGDELAGLEWAKAFVAPVAREPFPACDGGESRGEARRVSVGRYKRTPSLELSGSRCGAFVAFGGCMAASA